jgi:hypothetical protein
MSNIYDKLLKIVICALIAGDIAYAVYALLPRSGINLYEQHTAFPQISGIMYDGGFMPSEPAKCVLLRVTADGCPHCREDKSQYGQLRQSARSLQCKVIEVSPRAGQIKGSSDPTVAHLQYVDMQLAKVLIPYETPETIVLDNAGRVVWTREGAMDDSALSSAVKSLRALR